MNTFKSNPSTKENIYRPKTNNFRIHIIILMGNLCKLNPSGYNRELSRLFYLGMAKEQIKKKKIRNDEATGLSNLL